ncbi:cold-shock protein [Rhodanobacter sp. Root480]|jgi:cold shock CspA family protein|nr:cold-shock protein [Rhodanobacter sp. Root480]
MRTHGTLVKWNDDRGFGFIEPATGTEEVFVHVSAFPRDGIRPRIGEFVSFEIDLREDGKKRAVRIMRPGKNNNTVRRATRDVPSATSRSGALTTILGLLTLIAIGWYGYASFASKQMAPAEPMLPATRALPASAPSFNCDGRTRCSQMTSCAEATYFLKQCPGTQMDGDGDGEPCESQWCGASWSD